MKSITYIGPCNTTGYGYASVGYLEALDSALSSSEFADLYELSFKPIGNIDYENSDLIQYKPIIDKYLNKPIDNEIGICFWHLGHISSYLNDYRYKIAMSTFEAEPLTKLEVNDLQNINLYIASCDWNRTIVAAQAPKTSSNRVIICPYIVPHVQYQLSDSIKINLSKTNRVDYWSNLLSINLPKDTLLISNIGKFELRKGQIDIIRMLDYIHRPITVIAYWFNPFLHTKYPYAELIENNWKCTTNINSNARVYSKGNKNIVLLPPEKTREKLYSNAYMTHMYVCASKGEGFNIPLRDVQGIGVDSIFSHHTANCDVDFYHAAGKVLTEGKSPANDGIFFHGNKFWYNIDITGYIAKIESYNIRKESFYPARGYGDRYSSYATGRDLLNAIRYAK